MIPNAIVYSGANDDELTVCPDLHKFLLANAILWGAVGGAHLALLCNGCLGVHLFRYPATVLVVGSVLVMVAYSAAGATWLTGTQGTLCNAAAGHVRDLSLAMVVLNYTIGLPLLALFMAVVWRGSEVQEAK